MVGSGRRSCAGPPQRAGDDPAQRPFRKRLLAVYGLEIKDALLNVGQPRAVDEDLGHPCPSEPELAGELGTVAEFATVDGGLQPVGEREHAGDPGGAADGYLKISSKW